MNKTYKSHFLLFVTMVLFVTTPSVMAMVAQGTAPKPSWFSTTWLGQKWEKRKQKKRAENLNFHLENLQNAKGVVSYLDQKAKNKQLIVAKETYVKVLETLFYCHEQIQKRLSKANLTTVKDLDIASFTNNIRKTFANTTKELQAQLGTFIFLLNPEEFNTCGLDRYPTQKEINAQSINAHNDFNKRTKGEQTPITRTSSIGTQSPSNQENEDYDSDRLMLTDSFQHEESGDFGPNQSFSRSPSPSLTSTSTFSESARHTDGDSSTPQHHNPGKTFSTPFRGQIRNVTARPTASERFNAETRRGPEGRERTQSQVWTIPTNDIGSRRQTSVSPMNRPLQQTPANPRNVTSHPLLPNTTGARSDHTQINTPLYNLPQDPPGSLLSPTFTLTKPVVR